MNKLNIAIQLLVECQSKINNPELEYRINSFLKNMNDIIETEIQYENIYQETI